MGNHFFDIAFTPSVQAQQELFGSRDAYARVSGRATADDRLTGRETRFIEARDTFYLSSVTETGWPYVQHRGGLPGFVSVIDESTIAWAELSGNRQYVSAGNTDADDRVALIMVDYPNRRRLKLLGHLVLLDIEAAGDLAHTLLVDVPDQLERIAKVRVVAFDWNCPQHITPRYTLSEIEQMRAAS